MLARAELSGGGPGHATLRRAAVTGALPGIVAEPAPGRAARYTGLPLRPSARPRCPVGWCGWEWKFVALGHRPDRWRLGTIITRITRITKHVTRITRITRMTRNYSTLLHRLLQYSMCYMFVA